VLDPSAGAAVARVRSPAWPPPRRTAGAARRPRIAADVPGQLVARPKPPAPPNGATRRRLPLILARALVLLVYSSLRAPQLAAPQPRSAVRSSPPPDVRYSPCSSDTGCKASQFLRLASQ